MQAYVYITKDIIKLNNYYIILLFTLYNMVKICSNNYPSQNELLYNMHFNGFSYPLNSFQKHAIEAIVTGNHALVTAATGCGKSTCFQFAAEYFVNKGKKLIYCSPIKSLSNQMYYNLTQKYPHISVGIMTGDFKINTDASVLIVTTEILCNMLHKKDTEQTKDLLSFNIDFKNDLACVVFDEFHYINDIARGNVWENTIMMLPQHIQLLMLSATLDKPEKVARWIENRYTETKEVYIASTTHRAVPLTHYNYITSKQSIFKILAKDETLKKLVEEGINKMTVIQSYDGIFNDIQYHKMKKILTIFEQKNVYMKMSFVLNQVVKYAVENNLLPAICFILSRKQIDIMVNEITIPLLKDCMIVKDVKKETEHILRSKLPNFKEYLELPEYNELIILLEKGIGKHHAGMMPILREIVELYLGKGYIKLLLTTETFAMGVNFPIKTVIFTDINKFDGNTNRILHGHEFTQMSGRAGRLGIDIVGNVIHLNNLFKNVDLPSYKNMMKGMPQKLTSKFKISYNLILNLISNDDILSFCKKSMIQDDINYEMYGVSNTILETKKEIDTINNNMLYMRTPLDVVKQYIELEELKTLSINKKKKESDKLIENLKVIHKYIETDKILYQKYLTKCKELTQLQITYTNMEQYLNDNILFLLNFLIKEKFIIQEENKYFLTNKGIIASQIRELHCLVFANIIDDKTIDTITTKELISIFSCFTSILVDDDVKTIIPTSHKIFSLYEEYHTFEIKNQIDSMEYTMHYDLYNIMERWCDCSNSSECKKLLQELEEEKGIKLGDFIKAILKITNIASEMENIAEKIGNISLLSKLKEIPVLIQKYVAMNQSLYV